MIPPSASLKVSAVARRTGVSVRTLHYYWKQSPGNATSRSSDALVEMPPPHAQGWTTGNGVDRDGRDRDPAVRDARFHHASWRHLGAGRTVPLEHCLPPASGDVARRRGGHGADRARYGASRGAELLAKSRRHVDVLLAVLIDCRSPVELDSPFPPPLKTPSSAATRRRVSFERSALRRRNPEKVHDAFHFCACPPARPPNLRPDPNSSLVRRDSTWEHAPIGSSDATGDSAHVQPSHPPTSARRHPLWWAGRLYERLEFERR